MLGLLMLLLIFWVICVIIKCELDEQERRRERAFEPYRRKAEAREREAVEAVNRRYEEARQRLDQALAAQQDALDQFENTLGRMGLLLWDDATQQWCEPLPGVRTVEDFLRRSRS